MNNTGSMIAIYDFEIFPYALGDVLTWNIRTAMRCEEMGKSTVDIYICLDPNYPASIYQRGLVNPDNYELFFSELYSAFGTHPMLGNVYIYRNREDLLKRLHEVVRQDSFNQEAYQDYLAILKKRAPNFVIKHIHSSISNYPRLKTKLKNIFHRYFSKSSQKVIRRAVASDAALNNYFIKYIHSHEAINAFAEKYGRIPLLQPSLGCLPDVEELISRKFQDKIIVPFHLRLRRLDVGYGGEHSYARDSCFVEWYNFLKLASIKYPNVQFIALGRLQEKPLEILRLPNVTSLRVFGMGLGHELTLMLKSDFFIGSSSGFAALANFSSIPYYITRMNTGACDAYAIPHGADRLPFATPDQKLIYDSETAELLMSLLEKGIDIAGAKMESDYVEAKENIINIDNWMKLQLNPIFTARTTSRFYNDDHYRVNETAYLLLPYLERAKAEIDNHEWLSARDILSKLEINFHDVCYLLPQYVLLRAIIDIAMDNVESLNQLLSKISSSSHAELRRILDAFFDSRKHEDTISILQDELVSVGFGG